MKGEQGMKGDLGMDGPPGPPVSDNVLVLALLHICLSLREVMVLSA